MHTEPNSHVSSCVGRLLYSSLSPAPCPMYFPTPSSASPPSLTITNRGRSPFPPDPPAILAEASVRVPRSPCCRRYGRSCARRAESKTNSNQIERAMSQPGEMGGMFVLPLVLWGIFPITTWDVTATVVARVDMANVPLNHARKPGASRWGAQVSGALRCNYSRLVVAAKNCFPAVNSKATVNFVLAVSAVAACHNRGGKRNKHTCR